MHRFLLTLFLTASTLGFSQTKITVLDGYSDEDLPMEGVVVYNEKNVLLGETDSNGVFIAPKNAKTISLHYDGYEASKLFLYGKDIVKRLIPVTFQLETTQITSTDAEARKIIKQIIQNRKRNSINNLNSYEYKSYSKFLVTASTDSMPYILFPKNERDSSYNDVRKLLDESHLMLGERAMDHKFSKQFGSKNIVKATRISGTKIPMYEFMAMQPLSTEFYDDKIKLFFREFTNPASNLGLREYRYRISEPEKIDGINVIVIAFQPKKKIEGKQQIKGYLWIDEKTKAIARFYAENLSETRVAELEMDWTHYKDYWFPQQQRFRMDGGHITYPTVKDSLLEDGTLKLDTIKKRERVWLHLTTSFKDKISPQTFEAKEFRGYQNEIDITAIDQSDITLEAYRDEILTEMEKNTYVKIDSIGQKYNMDRNVRLMRILSSGGKYAIGKYDLDITKIFNYNDYEGFRLGLGGNTNYKFNEDFSINGYGAYGFKDKKFKYGGGLEWYVNKPYSGKVFAQYTQDVEASGRRSLELQNNYVQFLNSNLTNLYNHYFYSFKRVNLGYQQDLFQNLSFRVAGIYNEKTAEFDYQYQNMRPDERFLSFDSQLALRWAPKEQNVRTPYGKVTISSGLPVFYLTLTQGLNVFNADYTPTKLDFSYLDKYRSFLGQTDLHLHTGVVFGDTPIMNLYEGMGNAKKGDKIFKHFGVAGLNNFETMRPGEFYSDRYFMFNVSHKFAGIRLFKKEIFPDFIYRGLIGDMRNIDDHQFVSFNTPNQYYQEAGLEFNQLLFGAFGIGTYYRFGAYSHDTFDQNFFLKLTLKMTFF